MPFHPRKYLVPMYVITTGYHEHFVTDSIFHIKIKIIKSYIGKFKSLKIRNSNIIVAATDADKDYSKSRECLQVDTL